MGVLLMTSDCENEREKNTCCKSGVDYQEYPSKGILYENMNLSFNEFKGIIENIDSLIYSYVLTTVDFADNKFIQQGCGPNFQAGLITLCTCKHYMRSWSNIRKKDNIWIAGFTSSTLFEDDQNRLFYLMKVKDRFRSHRELWNHLDDEVGRQKSASDNIFGDIYEPKNEEEFSKDGYHCPTNGHVHANCWKDDVDYRNGNSGKRPVLLIGDPEKSYLWPKPKVRYEGQHPRTKKWKDSESLVEMLSKDGL